MVELLHDNKIIAKDKILPRAIFRIGRVPQFIRAKHIDSYQKLRFLFFIYQHPTFSGTGQEFANQLHLGYSPMIDGVIDDLHLVGLLDCVEGRFKLHHDPEIDFCLACLTKVFEDPLARQKVLDQVRHGAGGFLPTAST